MKYQLTCSSSGHEATLILEDGTLMSFPSWRCLEGEGVWGSPARGTCLSPRLTGSTLELALGCTIDDWRAEAGAEGEGSRLFANDGSFPEGSFQWSVESAKD